MSHQGKGVQHTCAAACAVACRSQAQRRVLWRLRRREPRGGVHAAAAERTRAAGPRAQGEPWLASAAAMGTRGAYTCAGRQDHSSMNARVE